eukprot:306802-Hanusia_phi.AAC.1
MAKYGSMIGAEAEIDRRPEKPLRIPAEIGQRQPANAHLRTVPTEWQLGKQDDKSMSNWSKWSPEVVDAQEDPHQGPWRKFQLGEEGGVGQEGEQGAAPRSARETGVEATESSLGRRMEREAGSRNREGIENWQGGSSCREHDSAKRRSEFQL